MAERWAVWPAMSQLRRSTARGNYTVFQKKVHP